MVSLPSGILDMDTPWVSFSTDGLSRKSLTLIIQLLAEDLKIAKRELNELKMRNATSCDHNSLDIDQFQVASNSKADFKIFEENLSEVPVNQLTCTWFSSH